MTHPERQSPATPAQPQPDDRVMRELHETRARHRAATKGLSAAEYAAQVEEEAAALLHEHGFAIRMTPSGEAVVVRQMDRFGTAKAAVA